MAGMRYPTAGMTPEEELRRRMMYQQERQAVLDSAPNNSPILGQILQAGLRSAPKTGIGAGMAEAGASLAQAIVMKKERDERKKMLEELGQRYGMV
jgi:hypothetical protein